MKKQLICLTALLTTAMLFSQQKSNASERSFTIKPDLKKTGLLFRLPKPVDQFVGGVQDPNNSSKYYDMYGSNGTVNSCIVFLNGVQQYGTGATGSGSYRKTDASHYLLNVTIHRGDGTSFTFNGVVDIS